MEHSQFNFTAYAASFVVRMIQMLKRSVGIWKVVKHDGLVQNDCLVVKMLLLGLIRFCMFLCVCVCVLFHSSLDQWYTHEKHVQNTQQRASESHSTGLEENIYTYINISACKPTLLSSVNGEKNDYEIIIQTVFESITTLYSGILKVSDGSLMTLITKWHYNVIQGFIQYSSFENKNTILADMKIITFQISLHHTGVLFIDNLVLSCWNPHPEGLENPVEIKDILSCWRELR